MAPRANLWTSERSYPVDAELAEKGRFHERNQYFTRSAHRPVYDPAAPLDTEAETAVSRVSITKDVPVLRTDHVSTEGKLLGVRQALYSGGVLDFKEINSHSFLRILLLRRPRYEKHQICCESEPWYSRS